MISPTVGRVVWFYKWVEGQGYKWPLAAIIAKVHSDSFLNLMVIDSAGDPMGYEEVRLLQDNEVPQACKDYCTWMPYQKGQAAKTEALEGQLAKKALRELTGHKVNPVNDRLAITVLDGPGAGGACHEYRISFPEAAPGAPQMSPLYIAFQNGPIAEVGVNGVTHEALLAILIDRFEHFQRGPYACEENRIALDSMKVAQRVLHQRTSKRMERGVEGTSQI